MHHPAKSETLNHYMEPLDSNHGDPLRAQQPRVVGGGPHPLTWHKPHLNGLSSTLVFFDKSGQDREIVHQRINQWVTLNFQLLSWSDLHVGNGHWTPHTVALVRHATCFQCDMVIQAALLRECSSWPVHRNRLIIGRSMQTMDELSIAPIIGSFVLKPFSHK